MNKNFLSHRFLAAIAPLLIGCYTYLIEEINHMKCMEWQCAGTSSQKYAIIIKWKSSIFLTHSIIFYVISKSTMSSSKHILFCFESHCKTENLLECWVWKMWTFNRKQVSILNCSMGQVGSSFWTLIQGCCQVFLFQLHGIAK